ncbi:Ig-like domain-containing protein [Micromonospora sp. NPDC048999]|uniref:Ig-like domain-containing protein n=1 Tax=Micromonospora sp. NPDC048999 TaxID=3155391 RepID=UPI0033C70B52
MKAPSSRAARAAALLGAAVLSSVAVVGVSSPAFAADLGTLTITPTSGSVGSGVDDATPMFTSATTSAACPTNYGTNAVAKVGPVGGPYNNLNKIGSDNNYDAGAFSLGTNRSMARALGAVPANGNFEIVIQCSGEILGDHKDYFRAPITVSNGIWKLAGAVTAEPTTTALTVAPAGTAAYGAPVTLTATVTPSAATGTVTFKRGASTVGTVPVSGGTASVTATDLPIGTLSLTAVFTPAGNDYAGSTSAAVSYQVTAPVGGSTGSQTILADVAPGAFSLGLAGDTANLTGGVVGGQATGALNKATVTDLRGTNAGWNLVGQVQDFVNGNAQIPGDNLGWTPNAAKVDASGNVVAGATAAPGAGTGLGSAHTLCKADSGTSAGVFACGAGLTLTIPDSAAPGSYAATLTLTLA